MFASRYTYGEKITFPSVAYATKTYIAADKYLVTDLQKSVEGYISKSTMDDLQFWEVITQEKYFRIPIVKKKCLEYIASKASTLFKSYLLENVSSAIMEEILQMQNIQIYEIELLRALVRWGAANVQPDTKLKHKLESLLRYIRFSNLTLDEFCNFLDCHPGLLDSDDSLSIIKHLHKRSDYKLPEWCCISNERRKGSIPISENNSSTDRYYTN